QLSKNFYTIYYNIQKLKELKEHIDRLDTLVASYQNQVIKRNVQLRDVVRLQSLLLEIQQDYTSITNENIALMQDLTLICGINDSVELVLNELNVEKFKTIKFLKLKIMDSLIQIHPDILYANAIVESRDTYLKWQKSLAKTDLTAGLSYDQNGGTFQNQVDITLGINLPLWNKNKGNIKAASINVEQAKTLQESKKNEVLHNFETAWQQWHINVKQTKNKNDIILQNLQNVYDGITDNFEKGNISIIEFCDFIDSFHYSGLQLNEIKKQWLLSSIQLNYVCNFDLF
ncbi:MAG: TolC family protein, partial [Sediminibacterium sp.]|nr:TolC family protein [Sediminibacterium sp.]